MPLPLKPGGFSYVAALARAQCTGDGYVPSYSSEAWRLQLRRADPPIVARLMNLGERFWEHFAPLSGR